MPKCEISETVIRRDTPMQEWCQSWPTDNAVQRTPWGEHGLFAEAVPISLSLVWRAPWNISNWIFHDVSIYPSLTTFWYKVKDLTTGFWKGVFLHSLLPSQFQHIERFSKCLKRKIIFQNITNGLEAKSSKNQNIVKASVNHKVR